MRTRITYKTLSIIIFPTLVLVLCFCLAFQSRASANSATLKDVTSVESVLVRKGDTVSTIARQYATEFSHISAKEYAEDILALNNMDSEYIQAGHYILLPNYR